MTGVDDHGHAAALAGLPHMGPNGLRILLQHHAPAEAWAVATGRSLAAHGDVVQMLAKSKVAASWRHADPDTPRRIANRCDDLGIAVLTPHDRDYPDVIGDDPQAPAVLFALGDLGALARRRVGVVGTRHATATGRATAAELAQGLARHGVSVVSGLARGIDGAAHKAVVEVGGQAIGVVGSGLDVVYPREHAELWDAVATTGLLLSELPPGVRPEPFRFPLRNRILAMLAEVLVVVESRATGGSLITADEAARRGRVVMAVPGSVRNPAATGTNDLLADGAVPARDLTDVLVALGLQTCAPPSPAQHVRPVDELDRYLDELLIGGGRSLDDLIRTTGRSLSEVARSVSRLEALGLITESDGWFERGHTPWGQP